jgi:hypothetical protein
MSTAPHPHADNALDPVGASDTKTFVKADLDALRARTGHEPSQADAIDAMARWDDYKDARLMKRVRNIASAVGVLGAAAFGVYVMFGGEEVKSADVKDAVVEVADEQAEKVEMNSQKIQVLGDLHYEVLDLQLQKGAQTDEKLEVIAEKLGVEEEVLAVPEPPAVKDAREEVAAHKVIVEARDKPKATLGDPFAGIDDKKSN